jgi:hypothetical protein
MRVSLQIDGDASGATKAAGDAAGAIGDLGKQTAAISAAIEAGFKGAVGSIEQLKNSSETAGAANDNTAGSVVALAQKTGELASKVLGAGSAFGNAAASAGSLAGGIGNVVKSASGLSILTGALGLAITVATAFYGVISSGSAASEKALAEQSRLIGVVRDAYSDASKTAGDFYTQSKNITLLQAQQNLIAQQGNVAKLAPDLAKGSSLQSPYVAPFGGEASIGFDLANAAANVSPFQKAIDDLHNSLVTGKPDVEGYRDAIAAIGLAASTSNPALAAQAAELLKQSQAAGDAANAVKKAEAVLAMLGGTASESQKKLLGINTTASDSAGSFERLAKAMDRQSAAQVAESQTAGQAAGVAATLRTQFILTEAAMQSGAGSAAKYADQIKLISDRAGDAAQKLALAKLQSDTAFQTAQLTRTTTDATVASQLQGALGNNADQNGAIANAIRLNEVLKDVKSTTQDIASGAFRDFRTELQNGATAWQALEKAALNALQKIIDKLADKALDQGISSLFNVFVGGSSPSINANGSISGAIGATSVGGAPLVGFDLGGYTGAGGKYVPAGIVHKDEFVFTKEETGSLGVDYLTRLARTARGYSDGGLVGGSSAPWGNLSSSGSGQGNSGSGTPQGMHISFGVTMDDDGKWQAYVKQVSAQTSQDGLHAFVTSPEFIPHVAAASRAARSYGTL